MKRLYTFLFLLSSLVAGAQTNSENYIQLLAPNQPVKSRNNLNGGNPDVSQEQIIYYDDFGRPKQQLMRGSTPDKKDLVTPKAYDNYGRTVKSYLPFSMPTGNGSVVPDAYTRQQNYYTLFTGIAHSTMPFSETRFEPSPLNRAEEQSAPGENFSLTSGHTKKQKLRTNTQADQVLEWQYNFNTKLPEVKSANQVSQLGPEICHTSFASSAGLGCVHDAINTRIVNPTQISQFSLTQCPQSTGGDGLAYAFFYPFSSMGPPNELGVYYNVSAYQGGRVKLYFYANKPGTDPSSLQVVDNWTNQVYASFSAITPGWNQYSCDIDIGSNQNFLNISIQGTGGTWNTAANNIILIDEVGVRPYISLGGPFIPKYYTPGSLTVKEETDEHGNIKQSFIDLFGNTVLVRQKASPSSNSPTSNTTTLETYSVFNDYQLLAAVVPPKACEALIQNNYSVSQPENLYDKYCFAYAYDERKRMVEKHLPGGLITYFVYDLADRLCMTQDNNNRWKDPDVNYWQFTKYDVHGRIAYSGIYWGPKTKTRQEIQSLVNQNPSLFETRTATTGFAYSNQLFPNNVQTMEVLNYSLYDNYDVDMDGTDDFQPPRWPQAGTIDYARNAHQLPTIAYHKVLGTINDYLKEVVFYDLVDRKVMTASETIDKGWNVEVMKLNFTGAITEVKTLYYKDQTPLPPVIVTKRYNYDHMGRLMTSMITPPNGPDIILNSNHYNALGQLDVKKIHGTDPNSSFLQTVDYAYNIRGWLKSMNDPNNLGNEDLLAMGFEFDNTYSEAGILNLPQFNGNISSVHWISQRDNVARGFMYQYDYLNRLTSGNYFGVQKQVKAGQTPTFENGRYDVNNLTYDANGNILSMRQMGLIRPKFPNYTVTPPANDYGLIDDLTYSYDGNRLLSVSDVKGVTPSGLNDFSDLNTGSDDYRYDGNLNVLEDKNHDILLITSNVLNLPERISWKNGDYLINTYDASGKKHETMFYHNNLKEIHYKFEGNIVYQWNSTTQQDEIDAIHHEEGRLTTEKVYVPNTKGHTLSGKYLFYYDYKDHLGNVRMTYTPQLDPNGDWMYTWDDGGIAPGGDLPGTGTGGTDANSDRPQFIRVTEPIKSPEQPYEGRYGAKVSDNNGPLLNLPVNQGDTIEASVYAKTMEAPTPSQGLPSWLKFLSLFGINPGTQTQVPDGVVKTGPQLVLNVGGLLYNVADLVNNNDDKQNVVGGLIMRTLDSAGNVLQAYSIPASSTSWDKISGSLVVQDPLAKQVDVFLSSRDGNVVYFDNLAVSRKRMLAKIVQENHYYPFGLNIKGLEYVNGNDTNHYKLFNGKEIVLRDMLEWNDFGARFYDPQIGRWHSPDPLAEKFYSFSPNNYCFNNPTKFIDPNGMNPYLVYDGKKKTITIYDDNQTKGNFKDDVILGTYKAHNNVVQNSNGKWEDGQYEMEDKTSRKVHEGDFEKDGVTPYDSPNGRYGSGGIYRAKDFTETTGNHQKRTGMAIHAGRLNWPFLSRTTKGCIRTTPEAMTAIDNAIEQYGSLESIIVMNNRHSTHSNTVNKITPGAFNLIESKPFDATILSTSPTLPIPSMPSPINLK